MLRVSATACSRRSRSPSKSSVARMRPRAARRGFSRPLSRAWRTTPHACSMSPSSSRCGRSSRRRPRRVAARSARRSRSAARRCGRRWRRSGAAALRSRSGGQTSRFTSRPTAMPMPVSSSRATSMPAVVAGAGRQHDERGRRGRRRSRRAGRAPSRRASADEDRQAERQRVEPEHAPEREGDEHAEHGRADLLDAAAERPVDGRVDGQQRRPRCEERLLDVEHVDREHPRDDRRRRPS